MLRLVKSQKLGRFIREDDWKDLGKTTTDMIVEAIDDERYEDAKLRHADFFEQSGFDPAVEMKRVLKVEKDIFSNLKINPEDLVEELKNVKED